MGLVGVSGTDLSGGADDYAYTAGEISAAYDEFADSENALLTSSDGWFSRMRQILKSSLWQLQLLQVAETPSHSFPHKGNQIGAAGALTANEQKERTLAFFDGMTSTSFAVFDSGYKYMYDRFNDKYRYVPCNGDVAGCA